MRNLHTQAAEDRLTKELAASGITPDNIAWMREYLEKSQAERPELLVQARRQDAGSLTPEQCGHCAVLLDRLLKQDSIDLRNRTVKAFFAVLGPELAGEGINQSRPWMNLFAQITSMPLERLLGVSATLSLYAAAWRGNVSVMNRLRAAPPESLEGALEYCGGSEDPARTVLAGVWLAKRGPQEKRGLLKAILGRQDGGNQNWAENMVREGVTALLPKMSPGLLSGDLPQLARYIQDGGDGPLPRLAGRIRNDRANLPAAVGSVCFLALEAAPALQSAFLVCAAVQPALTPRYALELTGGTQLRDRVLWMVEHTEFHLALNFLCTSSPHQGLVSNLLRQNSRLFETALAAEQPLRMDSPVAEAYRRAYPERFQALYDRSASQARAQAAESLAGGARNPEKLRRFLLKGEGLEELVPGHILSCGGFPLNGYNVVCLYGREYGLDDFMVRCLIATAMSSTLYAVSYCWNQTQRTEGQRSMASLMDRMRDQGLGAANCLAVVGVLYDGTYHDKEKKRLERESLEWLLAQPEGAVAECAGGCVYARCAAVRAMEARGDFEALFQMAQDSSKQVRLLTADLFAAHPEKEGPEAALRLLASKKAGQRETGLTVIQKLDQTAHLHGLFSQKYRPQLEEALAKEKSAKLAFHLRKLLGIPEEGAPQVSQEPQGDPVALALKGGKKRKLQWVLEGVPPTLEEDRLAAVMVSCLEGNQETAQSLAKPLDAGELAAYAQSVFEFWLEQKAPSKQKWVLAFAAVFGGRTMVDSFKRQLNQWPQESRGAIACDAVQALIRSPEPEALLLVDSISRKFKFKQVKAAAGRAMASAAEVRGISQEELADRIVPDLGLDRRGRRTFDYGSRSFEVSLTPALELEVRTQEGKKLKTLPAPGKQDDPAVAEASSAQFKALKKQIKATVTTQTLRLEQALSTGRTWTGVGWRELFVEKPVMRQFAVGLIWGVYKDGALTATFRYLEDGSLNTAEEDEYQLEAEAKVGLVHPVELSAQALEAWKRQLEDYELHQPIPQLDRPVCRLDPALAEETELGMFNDRVLNGLSLSGKLLNQGWFRGSVQDAGCYSEFYREDGGIGAQLNFSGMYVGGEDSDVEVKELLFYRAGTVQRGSYIYDAPKGDRLIPLGKVPPRMFSEIVYQVRRATASASGSQEEKA